VSFTILLGISIKKYHLRAFMDQRRHWNAIASVYQDEIFDVFAGDRKGILKRYFNTFSNKQHTVLDFGCGIGKAFPYLAPKFKKVFAFDISDKCLATAGKHRFSNIVFQQADLSDENIELPKVNFVFCCNVIMLPETDRNMAMFRNVKRALKRGGWALLIVPSMESFLFSAWRLIDWYREEGIDPHLIDRAEISGFSGHITDILQGLVTIDGVTTKHYSEPELKVILSRCGLKIHDLDRVEYCWNSEFIDPPDWMREPYPWDWLVLCR
jgi:SAM-dependent methyltransferase